MLSAKRKAKDQTHCSESEVKSRMEVSIAKKKDRSEKKNFIEGGTKDRGFEKKQCPNNCGKLER